MEQCKMRMKYRCLKCGTIFEVDFDVKCPLCGARDWDCVPFHGSMNSHPEQPPEASVPVAGE